MIPGVEALGWPGPGVEYDLGVAPGPRMHAARSPVAVHRDEVEAIPAERRGQAELDVVGLHAPQEAPLEPHDALADDLARLRVAAHVRPPIRRVGEIHHLHPPLGSVGADLGEPLVGTPARKVRAVDGLVSSRGTRSMPGVGALAEEPLSATMLCGIGTEGGEGDGPGGSGAGCMVERAP